jgi:hypothetical protein
MIGAVSAAVIRPRALGGLLGLAVLLAAPLAQAQQVCPGVPVPGVTGPITNGSSCSLVAMGSTSDALYVGGSASDEDVLSLPGSGNGVIFNNMTTAVGDHVLLTGISAGETLDFTLTNVTAGTAYVAGVAYTNTQPPFTPVYHFAYFDFANAAAYDTIFGASGPPLTADEIAYIRATGGFGDWMFVSVEDLSTQAGDDWNDLVFAFRNIETSPVPEPATTTLIGSGIVALTLLRRRRGKTVPSDKEIRT